MSDLPEQAVEAMGRVAYDDADQLREALASGYVQAFSREALEAILRLLESPLKHGDLPVQSGEVEAREQARAALDAMGGKDG